MKITYHTHRVIRKLIQLFRERAFKEAISCPHSNFTLVGNVSLINRNVRLGKKVTIYPGVQFFGDGMIEIGDNVGIGNNTIIYSSLNGGVKIGDHVWIGANSYITDEDHSTKAGELIRNQANSVAAVSVGNDVWLATDVTVLKGSVIFDGAVIGAKSLVKGKIPANAIAVGIPAKVIKYRSND